MPQENRAQRVGAISALRYLFHGNVTVLHQEIQLFASLIGLNHGLISYKLLLHVLFGEKHPENTSGISTQFLMNNRLQILLLDGGNDVSHVDTERSSILRAHSLHERQFHHILQETIQHTRRYCDTMRVITLNVSCKRVKLNWLGLWIILGPLIGDGHLEDGFHNDRGILIILVGYIVYNTLLAQISNELIEIELPENISNVLLWVLSLKNGRDYIIRFRHQIHVISNIEWVW
mmetsp:Transcript_3911/g.14799  ORF Transcript_3911/g.14799 Transcript_3911/m.14799 type:complete len:233 (-) Transcript_3911:1369-2067(-)